MCNIFLIKFFFILIEPELTENIAFLMWPTIFQKFSVFLHRGPRVEIPNLTQECSAELASTSSEWDVLLLPWLKHTFCKN